MKEKETETVVLDEDLLREIVDGHDADDASKKGQSRVVRLESDPDEDQPATPAGEDDPA